MTCVAWDGETLSADNQMTSWEVPVKYKKVHKINGCLTGLMGEASVCCDIQQWFTDGANPDKYPTTASNALEDKLGYFIVVDPDLNLKMYTRSPNPIVYGKIKFAFGSGMDVAIGAMEAGKTSREAVMIANKKKVSCGIGVNSISFTKPKKGKKK